MASKADKQSKRKEQYVASICHKLHPHYPSFYFLIFYLIEDPLIGVGLGWVVVGDGGGNGEEKRRGMMVRGINGLGGDGVVDNL